MGRVKAFELVGIECWFWSDDHNPPHFNAKRRGQWCFKVFFLRAKEQMLERERGPRGEISARDRRDLCRLAETHRLELLKEWERKVNVDD